MSENTELKPCPFCGGRARMYTTEARASYRRGVVRCTECGAEVRAEGGGFCDFGKDKTEEEKRALSLKAAKENVTAAWNRRTQ